MPQIFFPDHTFRKTPVPFPETGSIAIVGGTGVGKTRFMHALAERFGDSSFTLSALGTVMCEPTGSVTALFDRTMHVSPVAGGMEMTSDLDKLMTLLLHDEFRYLLEQKRRSLFCGEDFHPGPTRLDSVATAWKRIFPESDIMQHDTRLMFSTPAGDNPIASSKLSSGEKAILYYLAAVTYAPSHAAIFIYNPAMFVHPALLHLLWNTVEGLRPDCRFVYNSSDMEFINSRTSMQCVWVKAQDIASRTWEYDILMPGDLPPDLSTALLGSRRPILFIEGDTRHSIDVRLYPLVFPEYIVKPLGSCDKVIETTRSVKSINSMHHLESMGIVDRDRRTPQEVSYLRKRGIRVPEVAEVENIFLLPAVIRAMAANRKRNPDKVYDKVKRNILKMFASQIEQQVLQHVRHRMKRLIVSHSDIKAHTLSDLEHHLRSLPRQIDLRHEYETISAQFKGLLERQDMPGVLRVFNHKPMLPECGVVSLLGYGSKEDYITGVLDVLKRDGNDASGLRRAIRSIYG